MPGNHSRALIAGTRGSALARIQTNEALALIRAGAPGLQTEVSVIRTSGDRNRVSPLSVIGGRGVFVKELEDALLRGAIDLAVHSLKDVPPRLAPGLILAAVPRRADPRDALVSREGLTLARLPAGARVGTSSTRRRAQILLLRPDLQVVELRGNVETRIAKVRAGEADAAVLAAAGLSRIGRIGEAAEIFAPERMIPSPGQGALGLEARADDTFVLQAAAAVMDPASDACARAERAFLGRLGAGCTLPVAAHATLPDESASMRIRGMIASLDGATAVCDEAQGPSADAEALGARLAEALLDAGGRALLLAAG